MDKPDIVYEDDNIIVCNKKAGVASQSERSFANDLTSMLMTYLVSSGRKCNVHIINRLDKPVEGLVLYALNKKAAAGLSALSGEHAIEKYYYAVVTGRPENKGNYTDYLLRIRDLMFPTLQMQMYRGPKKHLLIMRRLRQRKFQAGSILLSESGFLPEDIIR